MLLLGLPAAGQKYQVMKKLMNQELKHWEMKFVVAFRAIRFKTYCMKNKVVPGRHFVLYSTEVSKHFWRWAKK
jgi:hypothetical protein